MEKTRGLFTSSPRPRKRGGGGGGGHGKKKKKNGKKMLVFFVLFFVPYCPACQELVIQFAGWFSQKQR